MCIVTRLLLLRARWRVWRGRCPKCNSDARISACRICNAYWKVYFELPTELTKVVWMKRFREGLK